MFATAEFGRLMAFGAGSFCLGAALLLIIIVTISRRYSQDDSEGCMGIALCSLIVVVALFFFVRAVLG